MILIVGGNGFVGQHVARHLLDLGEEVAVTTFSRGAVPVLLAPDVAAGRARVVSLDVTDGAAVTGAMLSLRPRIVIDVSGHAPKVLSPAADVMFRTAALTNVLEAARAAAVGRVVLMSSMDAYWGLPSVQSPFREDDPVPLLEPEDHYIVQSWAKKSLEVIGNLFRRQHGMDIVFVRASGVFGPLYRTYLNVPSRLVRAKVEGHEPDEGIIAEGGYDQVYVEDMATGICLVALAPALRHPVYNIGSGRCPTYGEFAVALSLTLPSGTASGPMDGRWMDIARARDELSYAPALTTSQSMQRYLAHVREWGF